MLSPLAYDGMERGARVALISPNGAACSRLAMDAAAVFAGSLVNAFAVARAVGSLLESSGGAVTVVACGERWPDGDADDGALRFAVEDYLGAGAILAGLAATASLSPEAEVCAGTFKSLEARMPQIIWECGSGIELREKGFGEDVKFAARIDSIDV